MKIVHVNEHKLDTLSFKFPSIWCVWPILSQKHSTSREPTTKQAKDKQSFCEIVAKRASKEATRDYGGERVKTSLNKRIK